MPLTRQQFYDFYYPQVNEFLKLQHSGRDSMAVVPFELWLERCLAQLQAEGQDELWEAVYYRSCFIRYNIWARCVPSEDQAQQQQIIQRALHDLQRPAQSETGRIGAAYARLAILLVGYGNLAEKPQPAELLDLINSLPPEYQDHQIWHPLSVLAFDHNIPELLDLAFEQETISPHSKFPQAAWQRINLMYQIMNGKATRKDVEETLKIYHLPSQFNELRRRMWPRLQDMGLIDRELERLLSTRELECIVTEVDFSQPRLENIRNRAPEKGQAD
ncbi:hypothetical protein IT575_05155 [bacterium]|nr:hypothetical protein [bacterium]